VNADSITVAGTWLRSLPGIPLNKVNTVLPPAEKWADSGFVQVYGVVGGTPHMDAPIRRPVVQVDAWAVRLDSERPPWEKASRLMDAIIAAAVGHTAQSVMNDLEVGDDSVRIFHVYPVSEVRKPPQGLDTGDPASYARLTVDLQFSWAIL
jgi:hypothetical protein